MNITDEHIFLKLGERSSDQMELCDVYVVPGNLSDMWMRSYLPDHVYINRLPEKGKTKVALDKVSVDGLITIWNVKVCYV